MQLSHDLERFGVPEENIRAAELRRPAAKSKRPFHTLVPTRKQVNSLPADELKSLLAGWMEHSPIEIIPSRGQILLVTEVLLSRLDADELQPLVQMCRNYAGAE